MIRAIRTLAIWSIVAASAAAQPSTQPVVTEVLADGTLSVPIPEGWQVSSRSEAGQTLEIRRDDPETVIVFGALPQTASLTQTPAVRSAMAKNMLKAMTDRLRHSGTQILIEPKLISDKEFFITIEDAVEIGGRTAHRRHYYRAMGVNLLMAAVTAWDSTPEQRAEAFELAGDLLWQIRTKKPEKPPGIPTSGKPTTFQKARLRLTAPTGWYELKTDAPAGRIAAYRQLLGESRLTITIQAGGNTDDPDEAARMARTAVEELKVETAAETGRGTGAAGSDNAGKVLASQELTQEELGVEYRAIAKVIRVGPTLVCVAGRSVAGKSAQTEQAIAEILESATEFRLP